MSVDLEQWGKELDAMEAALRRNERDRVQYDRSLKAYRDYNNTIDFAREEGEEKGRREGKEEGLREGKKEGLREGEEKGKIEERKNIARKMKSLGMDVPQIVESTGLTAEEIEEIE